MLESECERVRARDAERSAATDQPDGRTAARERLHPHGGNPGASAQERVSRQDESLHVGAGGRSSTKRIILFG